jgi:uncharacterized membrane protein YgcG
MAREQWHTFLRETEVEGAIAIEFCGDEAVAVPLHRTTSIAAAKAQGISSINKQLVIEKRLITQLIAHAKKIGGSGGGGSGGGGGGGGGGNSKRCELNFEAHTYFSCFIFL